MPQPVHYRVELWPRRRCPICKREVAAVTIIVARNSNDDESLMLRTFFHHSGQEREGPLCAITRIVRMVDDFIPFGTGQ